MSFIVGNTYSRKEIANALGGPIRDSLPAMDGCVVCGCFKKEARWNPEAPEKVVFGPGPRVEQSAQTLASQLDPIPIFIFSESAAWEFVGEYRCIDLTTDRAGCEAEEVANADRGPIAGVLWFEAVPSAA